MTNLDSTLQSKGLSRVLTVHKGIYLWDFYSVSPQRSEHCCHSSCSQVGGVYSLLRNGPFQVDSVSYQETSFM